MLRLVASLGAALAMVVMFAGNAAVAQQFSNYVSRLNLDRCVKVDRPGTEAHGDAYRCRGFKNAKEYDVYVFEQDGRFHISFGTDAFERKAAGQTLAPFNTIGDDLEWRLERRAGEWKPFAVIIRFFTEVEKDGEFYRGEVLVVAKLGPGEACHAVYIDAKANANANQLAREAADSTVRRFDCATQEPMVIGERGLSLGPTS